MQSTFGAHALPILDEKEDQWILGPYSATRLVPISISLTCLGWQIGETPPPVSLVSLLIFASGLPGGLADQGIRGSNSTSCVAGLYLNSGGGNKR